MDENDRFVPFDIEFQDTFFEAVESVRKYLKKNNNDYIELYKKRNKILDNNLNLQKLLDEDLLEDGLSAEECKMLSKLIILEFDLQNILEKEMYFKGGMDAYYYFKKIGILK